MHNNDPREAAGPGEERLQQSQPPCAVRGEDPLRGALPQRGRAVARLEAGRAAPGEAPPGLLHRAAGHGLALRRVPAHGAAAGDAGPAAAPRGSYLLGPVHFGCYGSVQVAPHCGCVRRGPGDDAAAAEGAPVAGRGGGEARGAAGAVGPLGPSLPLRGGNVGDSPGRHELPHPSLWHDHFGPGVWPHRQLCPQPLVCCDVHLHRQVPLGNQKAAHKVS
mmetsp:Transcript_101434/g.295552  ORF Transcript_101434/g.295552 Transcript_101434/m.295552 type:complete len:219 (-) Transcript_101434:1326-1982(-)